MCCTAEVQECGSEFDVRGGRVGKEWEGLRRGEGDGLLVGLLEGWEGWERVCV